MAIRRRHIKILFLDIETAPSKGYFWGLWGQNIAINQIEEPGYTLCWAARWAGSSEIYFSSVQSDGMAKMLKRIHSLLEEADAVVHYNGTNFDIPVLNWEFIKNEMEPPSPYHQIDLYKVVKSRFRAASNKLDFICEQLGLGGKVKHKGMELWKSCMKGDLKSWKEMERYNKQDVRLLPKLYKKLLPWIKNHPNHALYSDDTRPVCPNCGSVHVHKKGFERTATVIYQRYKCSSCGTPIRGRESLIKGKQYEEKRKSVLTQSKL